MSHVPLSGVIVPTVTALDEQGMFDEVSQNRLLFYLAASGVNGVFALGLTGEASFLSNETRREVMAVTAQAAHSVRNFGALVGVNGDTVDETISNIEYANQLPLDGVVVQPS